jgi:ATP-dependent RNA helicase DDX54/DBP10
MPHRAASPAASENDFDITKSLFNEDSDDETFATSTAKSRNDGEELNAGGILDLALESDGDDAFIAAQQSASNRKGTNVKGKSAKKGGGFQAMGKKLASIDTCRTHINFDRFECTSTQSH